MDNPFFLFTHDVGQWVTFGTIWLGLAIAMSITVAGFRNTGVGGFIWLLHMFGSLFLFDRAAMNDSSINEEAFVPGIISIFAVLLVPGSLSALISYWTTRVLLKHQILTSPDLRDRVLKLRQLEETLKVVKKAPYTEELTQKATELETSIRALRSEIDRIRIRLFAPGLVARHEQNEVEATMQREQKAQAALKLAERALAAADTPPDLPVVDESSSGQINQLPLASNGHEPEQLKATTS